jgi:hypothetical protein
MALALFSAAAACQIEADDGGASGFATFGDASETGDDFDPPGDSYDTLINPEGGDELCLGVDFLFVIDDSPSMVDNQAELAASVPGFVQTIETELSTQSGYRVGVTTTEAYAFNAAKCDGIGSLVTRTGGEESSNAVCGPYAQGTFMTEADDLASRFSCAIRVGAEGNADEKPLDAVRAALSEPLLAPGGCNEDFLRPDALLVVVLVTDEEDDTTMAQNPFEGDQAGSVGDPADWYADLVALKGGHDQNVVVLSLVGQDDSDCSAEPAPRLIEFTERFTNGFVGDVCAPNYAGYFADALDVVVGACNDFIPEG